MLFPYKYVPHQMDTMQEYIKFIFNEVWCKAPGNGVFRLDLFDGNTDLKEVMTSFFYDHTASGDFFYGYVERIYGHFATLTTAQIDQFKAWFEGNNNIERVCNNDPTLNIARYADIAPLSKDLCEQLGGFFKGLYSNLNVAALKNKIGNIDDHYEAFMSVNDAGKCPFCGITDMQGVYHSTREAYDHYLPKGLYPFNSINFHNLVPACHHCNSSYKTSKDPVRNAAGRRKAFYPYATANNAIDITIDLATLDIDRLTPAEIELSFGPPAINEEIDTWKDVYGIEERYRGKILNGDGKAWLTEVLDEWRWKDESAGGEGRAPDEYLRDLNRHVAKSPFTGANFIKKAFLDACERVGLFS